MNTLSAVNFNNMSFSDIAITLVIILAVAAIVYFGCKGMGIPIPGWIVSILWVCLAVVIVIFWVCLAVVIVIFAIRFVTSQ